MLLHHPSLYYGYLAWSFSYAILALLASDSLNTEIQQIGRTSEYLIPFRYLTLIEEQVEHHNKITNSFEAANH